MAPDERTNPSKSDSATDSQAHSGDRFSTARAPETCFDIEATLLVLESTGMRYIDALKMLFLQLPPGSPEMMKLRLHHVDALAALEFRYRKTSWWQPNWKEFCPDCDLNPEGRFYWRQRADHLRTIGHIAYLLGADQKTVDRIHRTGRRPHSQQIKARKKRSAQ